MSTLKQDQTFEFQGVTYTIDLIGPVTTLLSTSDGAWQTVETELLQRFLENKQ